MFLLNALQSWKNIGDNDFVYCIDPKKFRRNYLDSIMHKFTPDSYKTDKILYFFINVILSFIEP